MQLIYLYIGDIGRNIEEQSISFSDEYQVEYIKNEKRLLISKTKSSPQKIYGKNIIGIDLLVGRNGSGKSTIIELLGVGETERRHEFSPYRDDKIGTRFGEYIWFVVYHLKQDLFCVEGYNPDALSVLSIYSSMHEPNYAAVFRYDINTQQASFLESLQDFSFPHTKIRAISKNRFLLYTSRQDRSWYKKDMSYTDESPYRMFKRYKASLHVGNSSILKFLKASIHDKSFKEIMGTEPGRVKFSIKLVNSYDTFDFSDRKKEFSRCIYGTDDSLIRLPMPNIDSKMKIKSIFSSKQSMIIRYLEIIIATKYDESKKRIKAKHKYEEIKGTQDEQYIHRKEYLLRYLEKLMDVNIGDGVVKEPLLYQKDFYLINLFCEGIENIGECFFKSGDYIEIPLVDYTNDLHFLDKLMKALDENDEDQMGHIINHKYYIRPSYSNLSSGEMEFIHLYASLKNNIEIMPQYGGKNDTCILLLDEPDAFFHPEWSRIFIRSITRLLSTKPFRKFNYQILVATNSPILLADVPVKHIHCLSKGADGQIHVSMAKNGFLSNINTIMLDSMFVESSFGSFAEQYVNEILKKLRRIEKQVTTNDTRNSMLKIVHNLEEQLDVINEPVIRKHIERRLLLLREKIYAVSKQDKGGQIRELLNQISRLESGDEIDD